MCNISMIRVDERLVHGQILIKWIQEKNINQILIIDDEIAENPIMKNILSISLPKSVDLEIYSLDEGIQSLRKGKIKGNLILLVRDLHIVKYMYQEGIQIKEINIGRLPSEPKKKKIHSGVFLSDKDMDVVNYFRNESIPIVIQIVPDSSPVLIYDLV